MGLDQNYSQSAVPKSQRVSALALVFIMIGFSLFSASMWSGGIIGLKLSFWDFIIVVVLGSFFLSIYTSILGLIGVKSGLNTNLLYQNAFGVLGSKIPSLILAATQTGWFGVGIAMLAIPLSKITGWDVRLLIIIVGVIISSNVFFGIKGLTLVSSLAVPGIIILGLYSIFHAVKDIGGFVVITQYVPEEKMSIVSAISIVIGAFISGGTLTADYLRFGKKVNVSIISCILAFFLGNCLMFVFGAFGAISTGFSDISDVMIKQGLLIPGLAVLIMNIWTTNDNSLYVIGLAMSNLTGLPSKVCSFINGTIGTLAALWMYNNFVQFLTILSSVVPTIGGVIIADYLLNKTKYHEFKKHQKSFDKKSLFSRDIFNTIAFTSLILGILASYLIPGIPSVNAVFTAFFSHIVLNLLFLGIKNKGLLKTLDR